MAECILETTKEVIPEVDLRCILERIIIIRSADIERGGSIMLTTIMTVAATAYSLSFLDMVLWNESDGVKMLGR